MGEVVQRFFDFIFEFLDLISIGFSAVYETTILSKDPFSGPNFG